MKLGIRDFKAKSGRDSGLKVCAGGGMPKVTLGITGLPEILGRGYGIDSNFGNQKCHLRNQTRQILEIKNAFEKSNATNLKSK